MFSSGMLHLFTNVLQTVLKLPLYHVFVNWHLGIFPKCPKYPNQNNQDKIIYINIHINLKSFLLHERTNNLKLLLQQLLSRKCAQPWDATRHQIGHDKAAPLRKCRSEAPSPTRNESKNLAPFQSSTNM